MSGTGKRKYYSELLPINHVQRINSFWGVTLPSFIISTWESKGKFADNCQKKKDLASLRQEKGVHDKALESARADQTNARCDAEGEEYKKAEKVLGSKVLLF